MTETKHWNCFSLVSNNTLMNMLLRYSVSVLFQGCAIKLQLNKAAGGRLKKNGRPSAVLFYFSFFHDVRRVFTYVPSAVAPQQWYFKLITVNRWQNSSSSARKRPRRLSSINTASANEWRSSVYFRTAEVWHFSRSPAINVSHIQGSRSRFLKPRF